MVRRAKKFALMYFWQHCALCSAPNTGGLQMPEVPALIDISHHQGTHINFDEVKAAGVQGVWMKATEGSSFKDGTFAINSTHARSAGLHVGAYHFATARASSAVVQADNFLSVIGEPQKHADLRAALDIENSTKGMSKGAVVAWIDTFLDKVHAAGWQTITYSTALFAKANGFDDHPSLGWIARFGPKPPVLPFKVWQFTEKARIPGIAGLVDGDRFSENSSINAILTK
jgi:GH25 family lysozyme M1 (1,4-beta-N-acetylmuramidase)